MPDMKITDFLRHDAQAYGVPGSPSIERILEVCVAAANWIDKLESRLAQVERERDAAVFDLGKAMSLDEVEDCSFCKNIKKPYCDPCKWEWRGVCAENTDEETEC